ncbi:hypothetical protein I302_103466 [Kwoniella bestiolae CBS 10118]|uniref:Uncharacterized protein n=1 Tax=Kwoniella bestiolae CBS 10118 TaxID=1296100 RepID=A0A1B9G8H9_9TREE|nr:hypothetical protein I302_02167 [Kwoniella bestiolae CBS 10118]OCF27326.1 hypothetical protein I302_02167 [Kwoniella bestiolae CBS 10118]
MSSYHPFAARPSLTKRRTSPSPAVLLSLPTLEALPPTPRSAKSYEPLNDFAPSSSHSHRQNKSISLSGKMPLIKPRSKRPTSPRSEHYSFLPSIVSALDPRGSSSSGSQKHSRSKSRSQPLPPSPNFPSSNDFDFNIPPSFSSSTPPSTYSKGTSSLNALPSIQGVFDFYEDGTGAQRKEKGRFRKEKRDTLKLPMMNPSIRDRHPFDEKEEEENWHWDGFNQPAEVVITREAERSSTNHDQSVPRRRNTSLSINTHLAQPAISREPSSSSQNTSSHSHSHYSLPAQSRSSNRSSLVVEERSPLSHWLGPEEEDLDDVELQALNVLKNLSGHLLRDGFGYGTGACANAGKPEGVPSLTRSGNSTPSKTRSRSTTYSTQATSEIDNTKRYSQVSDSPSIREWRENRKRTKSQGHALGRPVSEQQQPTQTHTRGSMSISRRPPPPPPPPEGSLPPLPTQIQLQPQTQTQTIKNNKQIVVEDENIVTDQVNFLQDENNKKSVRSGSASGYTNNTSIPPPPPPPIPPRSASRLDSHASASVHRSSSASQLRPRPQTPVQRKGSKEKQGVKVPLVFSTTSSPAITTREEEEDLVVVIDKRPPTPAREMSSPTIPVHQRPLPPLPTLPNLSSLASSPQPQRSALAQLAHPRLPTRLLRPKRPSTAGNPPTNPLHEISKPLTRLVPREEPRRLSSSSRVEGTEGRKNGMTALSFLALDDAAIANLSARSAAGRSGRTSSFDGGSGYGNGRAKMESPTRGLSDAGYIIPPSERSKIGIDDRKESRRRRRGSQSSLSSIAGSEITNVNVIDNDVEVEGVEVKEQGEGEEWTTAYEYGQSKVKQRLKEKELRLSLDIGVRPTSTSPMRSKPPPLNIFSLNDYSTTRGQDSDDISYPKSAGLLPPPRPRRKTTPSAPPQLVQPKSPVSPKSKTPAGLGLEHGQLSPKYTHRSISNQQEEEVEDGFKDFMDLNSPILPSPNLTTPGQAYVFPPSTSRDLDLEGNRRGLEQERKVSTTTTSTQRTNQSDGDSSNWSNDTYERERKLITSLWLSSKPTRSKTSAPTMNHEGSREGEAQQHPFYSLGRSNKLSSTTNAKGTVVVDGGYGRRDDFGVKI